ncbi:MAG TPA: protein kinase, partial [Pirellulaceae bacterium]|nr:protein kinase [Pirellulaceae bacterium]
MANHLKTSCTHCQSVIKVNASHIGKRVRCPSCRQPFAVSTAESPPPSAVDTGDHTPAAEVGTWDNAATISRSPPAESLHAPSAESQRVGPAPLAGLGRLGRFELRAELGRGAFGVVYRAYDPQLDRELALKVPTFDLKDTPKLARFQAEAKSAAKLRHPNIVPTYESGVIDGRPYIATQFIAGQTLADRLQQGPPDLRQAAEWVRQLASALAYAHSQQIIHRDIKPANIMLDERGVPQIMDFGLAKRLHDDATMTTDGSVLGTPAYMSPEQARGEQAAIGPASDQYSLGVVLYELLTGEKPYAGSAHAVLAQVLGAEPLSPRHKRRSIPLDLNAICEKAISKSPGSRYASAGNFANDLSRWLEGLETHARPTTSLDRAFRWTRRNPLTAGLIASVVVAVIGGAAFSTWFAINANQWAAAEATQRQRADKETERAGKATAKSKADTLRAVESGAQAKIEAERAKLAAADAKRESERANQATAAVVAESERAFRAFYAEQLHLVQRDAESGAFRAAVKRLQATMPEHTGGVDLRGFEWHYWNRVCRILDQSITFGKPVHHFLSGFTCLQWKDERTLFVGYGLFQELAYDTQQVHSGMVPGYVVALSPDGSILMSRQGLSLPVTIHDTRNHGAALPALRGPQRIHRAAISHDNARIATSSEDDALIRVWDVATGDLVSTLTGHSHTAEAIAFDPTGKRLATGGGGIGGENALILWDVASGQQLPPLTGPPPGIQAIRFHPARPHLAAAGADGTVCVWNVDDGQRLFDWTYQPSTPGAERAIVDLAYSRDGSRLAASAFDAIAVLNAADGAVIREFEGSIGRVQPIAFAPDGSALLGGCCDGTLRIWSLTTQFAVTKIVHTSGLHDIAFLPSSNAIAATCADGMVRVWDCSTGTITHTMQGLRGSSPVVAGGTMDSPVIASPAGNRHISLWKADGTLRQGIDPGFDRCVHLSMDEKGSRLALGDNKQLAVFDTESGKKVLDVPL